MQSDNNFLRSKSKNMNKISFFSYLGGPGGPYVKPKVTIFFMEVGPYDSADMYNKGKK